MQSPSADVRFGSTDLSWPCEELGQLRDAPPTDDPGAVTARLRRDGYLLFRQLIDRDRVLAARSHIAEVLLANGALDGSAPADHLVIDPEAERFPLLGRRSVTHHPTVLDVIESEALAALFTAIFGEAALTFDFKWLRATGHLAMTGAHVDAVYMGRGSDRLLTAWIPFADLEPRQGTLAIVPGSHRLTAYSPLRETYGRMDVDRDNIEGWFTDEPLEVTREFGGRWCTAEVAAGDVIVFTMQTVHASTTNLTTSYRISCDTRFQPATDPADLRWMGADPPGHVAHADPPLPIHEARRRWGL